MSRELPPDRWILEGLLTTLAAEPAGAPAEQRVNIAPMGPIVDRAVERLVLRPFQTSTTYRNLVSSGQGVFHVTDDALLIARAALAHVVPGPDLEVRPARQVCGLVLTGACRYHELVVDMVDDHEPRARIEARVVESGHLRDFFGFNRARHAVLEAAILATRVHLSGAGPALARMRRLQVLVDKTGGEPEHQAMCLLEAHVRTWAAQPARTTDRHAE